eukprot:SAG11_NODE_799_length_7127_cov_3.180279_4_plen_85_part_00
MKRSRLRQVARGAEGRQSESVDGAVEAYEGHGGQLHGVQWHPEKMISSSEGHATPMVGIFEDLVRRAHAWRTAAVAQSTVSNKL